MPSEVSTPKAFKCPITKQTLQQPVLEADGHTYDKQALDAWDKHSKGLSPKTGKPLSHLPRVPNDTLARALGEFRATRHACGSQRDEWKRHTESAITYEPLKFPVRLSDGHDYEFSDAVDVCNRIGRSVFTQQMFVEGDTTRPNFALQALSAEVHGFKASAYPHPNFVLLQELPAAPAMPWPIDEAMGQHVMHYLRAFDGHTPIDVTARTTLITGLQQALALYATELRRQADAVADNENKLLYPFEGCQFNGIAVPNPTDKMLQRTSSIHDLIAQTLTVLKANDVMSDDVTARLVLAVQDFLIPRLRLSRGASFAAWRGTLAGAGALSVVWGLGLMQGMAARSLYMQLLQHACSVGIFLAETAIARATSPRPATLAQAIRDRATGHAPQAPTSSQVHQVCNIVGPLLRTAAAALIGAGAGGLLSLVTPPDPAAWNQQHYQRLTSLAAITAGTLAVGVHLGRFVNARIDSARLRPIYGWLLY